MAAEKGPGSSGFFRDTNSGVAAAIALAITALFVITVGHLLFTVGQAPVADDLDAGTQGFDPFARSVQVVALVTPILTTVLGFYYGVRAGSGGREAAESRATQAELEARESLDDATRVQQALATLDAGLAGNGDADKIRQEVRETFPEAFSMSSWLTTVKNISPPTQ